MNEIENSGAVQVESSPRPRKTKPGTTITLRRLRKKWTDAERIQLQAEVDSFQPPDVLVNLPKGLVPGERLFDRPKVGDVETDDTGLRCDLIGDFATGESFWPQLALGSQWLVEIDARSRRNDVRIRIAPTKNGKAEFVDASVRDFQYKHPDHGSGPHFVARILVREGKEDDRGLRQWMSRSFGVRVYCEGFRVLPYGEPNNDWLLLDADYKTRAKTLKWLEDRGFEGPVDDETEGHQMAGNKAFYGAVFLTTEGAPNLRMLVNREGFSADSSYDNLVDILKTAIYLSFRVRAAAKVTQRKDWREARQGVSRADVRTSVLQNVASATQLASEARRLAAQGDIEEAAKKIDGAAVQFVEGAEGHQRLMTEGAILRVLASVGTQIGVVSI